MNTKMIQQHNSGKKIFYDNTEKLNEISRAQKQNSVGDEIELISDIYINANNEKHILFVPLADIHYGGQGFRRDKFLKVLNWIKSVDCITPILGDSLDLATSSSATNVQTYQTNSEKSRLALMKDLEIIKDQLIDIIPGNHTSKHGNRMKESGLCAERPIADHLSCHYSPYHSLIDIITKNDKHTYIALTHGDLAKDFQNAASRLIEIVKKEKNIIVDAVYVGHYHHSASFDQSYTYREYNSKTQNYETKYKTITVESLPAFQELNEHAASNGYETEPANARAFDFVFDSNGEIENVITFNILNEKGEYTKTAKEYLDNLSIFDKEKFKQELREKYSEKLICSNETKKSIKILSDEMLLGGKQ